MNTIEWITDRLPTEDDANNWLHVATDYARATIAKAGVNAYEKNPKYAERMVRWWDRYAGHMSCESIDQLRAANAKAKREVMP
jgi:hypothetical protein